MDLSRFITLMFAFVMDKPINITVKSLALSLILMRVLRRVSVAASYLSVNMADYGTCPRRDVKLESMTVRKCLYQRQYVQHPFIIWPYTECRISSWS